MFVHSGWSTVPGPRTRHGDRRTIGRMRTMRVALVQFEARDDVQANMARAATLASEAALDADLVVLPEYVQFRGTADGYRASARAVPGATTAPFAAIARRKR